VALARTNLLGAHSGGSNFGAGNYVTTSFTPPNNSLLVVGGSCIENGGSTDPTTLFTVSGGSLTFTEQKAASVNVTSFGTFTKVWTAPISTGTSMTLTFNLGGRNVNEYSVSVVAYTGYNTGTPIGATASGTANGGFTGPPDPASITLSSAPATDSEVFGWVGIDKSTLGTTPGAGFTEIDDLLIAGAFGGAESEVRTASVSTTVNWVDLRDAGGSLFNYAAVAVEIKASAAGTTAPNGIAIPVALGSPTVALNRSAAPNGIAIPLGLGTPSAAIAGQPTGLPIPINLGNPTAGPTVISASAATGSWYGLLAVQQENRLYAQESRRPPVACPNDGEPLLTDPRTGKLRCRYDGWIYQG
jgi:hypothetical protein